MKTFHWLVPLLGLAGLTACSPTPEESSAATPVWVVHAANASGAAEAVYPGDVRAQQESTLSFRVAGNVIARHVDAGQRVRKGQVLAELDVADFGLQARAAQAQLAAAEADLVRSRDEQARYATLASQQLVSRSALDQRTAAFKAAQGQVNAARANWDVLRNQAGYAQLRAPANGLVASRSVEVGQVVAAGEPVFTLAADGGREVVIALPERDVRAHAVGDAVSVELWNRPGQRLPGHIREIAAAADSQTRSYLARVALDAAVLADVELGQSARVYSRSGANGALRLPLAALQRGEDGSASVWVVDPRRHTLKAIAVTVGAYGSEQVPVLSGLSADDWVVAAGGHLLREGQPVTAVDRNNHPVLGPVAASTAKAAAQGKE